MRHIKLADIPTLLNRQTYGEKYQVDNKSLYVDNYHYSDNVGYVIRVYSYNTLVMQVTRYGIIETGYMQHSPTTSKHCRAISKLFWQHDIATYPLKFYCDMARSCGVYPEVQYMGMIDRLLTLTGQRYYISDKYTYGKVYNIKWSKASH